MVYLANQIHGPLTHKRVVHLVVPLLWSYFITYKKVVRLVVPQRTNLSRVSFMAISCRVDLVIVRIGNS